MAHLKPNEPGPNINKCSMCNGTTAVMACGDGFICEPCSETNRTGRDNTTQRAKLSQKAMRGKSVMARASVTGAVISDLDAYAIESSALLALDDRQEGYLLGAGGEALPQGNPELRDTMQAPGAVALDASAERLRLVSQVGVDAAAMALDTADSIKAANSLERMLSAQLAVLHSTALNYVSRANLNQNLEHSVRVMNLGIRAMEVFQRGVLTVKRLRSSGEQRITISHVSVNEGGQAAFGSFQPRGTGGKS